MSAQKVGKSRTSMDDFDSSETMVFDPKPKHPDDPENIRELTVLTAEEEEEEAAEKGRQTLVAKAKWSTRGKIVVALGFVLAIVSAILLALANMSNRDEIKASNAPTKVAPAPSNTVPAPIEAKRHGKAVKVPVAMVAAVDFTSCKTFNVVTLDNGNKRAIGSDCAPLSVSPAKAEAPATATEPAASAAITTPAASIAPATEPVLTADQTKTATVVKSVTDEVLEDLHSEVTPPEGAIEATELEEATTPTTPSGE